MGFNEFIGKLFGNKATRDMKEIKPWVDKVKAVYPEISKLNNDELRARTEELKKYIKASALEEQKKIEELKATIETTDIESREPIFNQIDKLEKDVLAKYEKALDDVLPQAFSIVKETARRLSENEELVVTATEFDRLLAGQGKDFVRIEGDKAIWQNHWMAGGNEMTWNMVHYDVQLFGGVVLHKGKIAEMATGEGKTLVATLPVFLNALTGNGVHVVTVNDYLAKRDATENLEIYEFCGVSVDFITETTPIEHRNEKYSKDVLYIPAREAGYDYIRNFVASTKEQVVGGEFDVAIVDEADSILIDEAAIPLVLAGRAEQRANDLIKVVEAVKGLENADYDIDEQDGQIWLNDNGIEKIENAFLIDNLYADENNGILADVNTALEALHRLERDKDYIVRDGSIAVIDESTGRIAVSRKFPNALHRFVEIKEGITDNIDTKIYCSMTIGAFMEQYKTCSINLE